MIRWVPFDQIGLRQLNAVAESLLTAPEAVRLDKKELMEGLAAGKLRMFEWDGGLFIVHQENNRLVIDAMTASIFDRRTLADDLRRLAADWLCDTVQTTVFDRRLADAIVHVGGRIESYDVILPVGTSDASSLPPGLRPDVYLASKILMDGARTLKTLQTEFVKSYAHLQGLPYSISTLRPQSQLLSDTLAAAKPTSRPVSPATSTQASPDSIGPDSHGQET